VSLLALQLLVLVLELRLLHKVDMHLRTSRRLHPTSFAEPGANALT